MKRSSISKTSKGKGGRPRVDATPILVRLSPTLLRDLDAYIAAHEREPVTRPEAIRRILETHLLAGQVKDLDQQLARVEQKLARKVPVKPSPEKGVALLQHGLAELEHQALVAKTKAPGRKTATDPDAERRPDQATGKKGRGVKDGSLTRRALVSKTSKPRKP